MIKQLPQELINKIAAGEVVERASSVVKEIIENSIDANASEIIIEIEENNIRIKDNGHGIAKSDLEKLFVNHSTSKIVKIEDLTNIHTMGFRGEAIATIASVSHMSIHSKPKDEAKGHVIDNSGQISPDALNTGTIVEVKDLFYNVPARKKFLKSISQENRYIIDIVRRISIVNPQISFKLTINNKSIFNLLVSSINKRIETLIPNVKFIKLIPDELISGFISLPKDSFGKAVDQYMFVNNRLILPSSSLSKAVFLGYKNSLMRGQYPPYILFINVSPSEVDVNVHPRKTEVKFENDGYIFQKIYSVIQHTLFRQDNKIFPSSTPVSTNIPDFNTQVDTVFQFAMDSNKNSNTSNVTGSENTYNNFQNQISSDQIVGDQQVVPYGSKFMIKKAMEFTSQILNQDNEVKDINIESAYQYLKSYIICEGYQDLILFDQHACTERYLFEKFKNTFNSKEIKIKKLLIPELIPPEYEEFIIDKKDVLKSFGIEVEQLQGKLNITGIPEFANLKIIDKVYSEIRNIFDSEINSIEDLRDKFITTLACHSAIRFGDNLSPKECKKIITDLQTCNNKLTCPHGRPTFHIISKEKLKEIFKR